MSSLLQLLFVGDIVGQPGRRGFKTILPEVVREHQIDVVVANIENAAGGFGVTLPIYQELLQAGVSCFTSGNHVYDQKKSMGDFAHMKNLVRPLNFYSSNPGKGFHVIHTEKGRLGIVNLIGRVFMGTYDCPFRCISDFLPTVQDQADAFFIDFHAETTSEKQAMGWFLTERLRPSAANIPMCKPQTLGYCQKKQPTSRMSVWWVQLIPYLAWKKAA